MLLYQEFSTPLKPSNLKPFWHYEKNQVNINHLNDILNLMFCAEIREDHYGYYPLKLHA
jgi:hypothetical protein